MTSSWRRGGFGLTVVLVLAISACGGGKDDAALTASTSAAPAGTSAPGPSTTAHATTTTAAGSVVSVTVQGGQVQGPSRQRVELNDTVTVRVASDVADEVHVHGYDQTAPVAAGSTGQVSFVADIPGVFEVEFEQSGQLLFTLEVRS